MFKAIGAYFRNYANFKGRARRRDLLLALLGLFLMTALLGWIGGAVLGWTGSRDDVFHARLTPVVAAVYGCFILWGAANIIPVLSVSVRRLHDAGFRGWWLLIGLVPVVGALALVLLLLKWGVRGANQYGPDPREGSRGRAIMDDLRGKAKDFARDKLGNL